MPLNPGAISGGNAQVERDRSGLFATPPDITGALARRYAKRLKGERIWEPCAGSGALSKVLIDEGLEVAWQTDIAPAADGIEQRDFFGVTRAEVEARGIDAIFTNPPFPVMEDWIRHCMALGVPFVALLHKAIMWNTGWAGGPLFKQFPPNAVHPLTWRPDFTGEGSGTMDLSWSVWDFGAGPLMRVPAFEPLPRPVDLRPKRERGKRRKLYQPPETTAE